MLSHMLHATITKLSPTIHPMGGEALAVVWAISHFRLYLYGQRFTLVTDHQPFKWLMKSDKLTGKLSRWALLLQKYDFGVVHRATTSNLDAR